MAKVLIPNIFITNRYETIKQFFLDPSKQFKVSDLPSSDGSLLITPKKNKYLQSFDYSFNYSQQSKNPILVLEFVDTDGKFEDEFLIKPYDSLKSQIHSAINKNNEAINVAVGKLKEINKDQIESQLQDLDSLFAIVDRIYVSFGEGTDIENWSDPLAFTVIGRKIDVPANGLKKYKFTFAPSVNPLFRPRLRFNQESPNPEREFFFLDNSYVSIGGLIPYEDLGNGNGNHINILYKLIEDYISKITLTNSKNIIGILPYFGLTNNFLDIFSIKEVTQREYEDRFSDIKTKLNTGPPQFASQTNNEFAQRKSNNKFYSITADILDTKINPKLPNWQSPFDKINVGLKSLLKLSPDNDFVLIQETNVKLLNFWQETGLIQDASKPCIIFGPERMIYEYLHVLMIPGETDALTAETLSNTQPSLPLATTYADNTRINEIYNLLYNNGNSTYKIEYSKRLKKNKRSSLFKEKITVDEFAVSKFKNQFISNYFNDSKLAELLDIPVFSNNIKNSNVLDIELQNDEVYFNALRITIERDYAKYFLTQVSENIKNINIRGIKIDDLANRYNSAIRSLSTELFKFDNSLNTNFKTWLTVTTSKDKLIKEFDIYKKILIQQLYIAKRNKEKFNSIYDLFKLEPKPEDVFVKYETIYYESVPVQESVYRPQTLQEIEKDIITNTGNDIKYDINTNKELITKFNNITGLFENIFIKDFSNIDFHKLLIAYSARIADIGKLNFKESLIEIRKNFGIDKQEEYFKYATLLMNMFDISETKKNNSYSITFKPKDFGLSQSNLLGELASHISNNAYMLNIKTLPYFQISTYKDLFYKPCILLSKKILLESLIKKDQNDFDFFTGVYNILGFRHVITTRDCYSQFLLYKNTIKTILN